MFTKKIKKYLIHFAWYNDVSLASGQSSLIVTLGRDEMMDAERISRLQHEILSVIQNAGDGSIDPTEVTVLNFTKLDD